MSSPDGAAREEASSEVFELFSFEPVEEGNETEGEGLEATLVVDCSCEAGIGCLDGPATALM